jgi:hypothetical protein
MSDDLIGGRGLLGARRRGRDAQRLAEAGTPQAARTLVRVLLQGADGQLAEIAGRGLRGLTDQAAIDALCEAPLEYDDTRLTTLIDEAGHRHSDPARRATLLFLAGDFDAYAELDFDGRMLAAARAAADGPLRTRLAARARESGRLEWVRAIAPARPGSGAAAGVSEPEWDAVIGILTATGRLDELWRLVQQAPPVWGVRILGELNRRGWRPPGGPDAAAFDELTTLAGACSDLAPAEGLGTDPAEWEYGMRGVSLAFTTDGSALVTGNGSGDFGAWWIDGVTSHYSSSREGVGAVDAVLAVPAADLVAVGGTEGALICRLRPPPFKGSRVLSTDGLEVFGLAATSDGRLVAGVGHGVLVWRPPWREPEFRWPPAGLMRQVAVSPAGSGCVAGLAEGSSTVWLWDLGDDDSPTPLSGHDCPVHCLATTPDGELLASGGNDGAIRLWRLPSGEPAGVMRSEAAGDMQLAVTPDGSLLISATAEGALRLWHLPSGAPAGVLAGRQGPGVDCLAIRPDGEVLASGHSDATVRLWQLPSGEPVGTLTGSTGDGRITDLAFSPDCTRLAAGRVRGDGSGAADAVLWHMGDPALWVARQVPVGALGPDTYDLPEVVTDDGERAWARLVAGLVRWRRRHDVELGDAAPDGTDIEIDRGPSGRLRS